MRFPGVCLLVCQGNRTFDDIGFEPQWSRVEVRNATERGSVEIHIRFSRVGCYGENFFFKSDARGVAFVIRGGMSGCTCTLQASQHRKQGANCRNSYNVETQVHLPFGPLLQNIVPFVRTCSGTPFWIINLCTGVCKCLGKESL